MARVIKSIVGCASSINTARTRKGPSDRGESMKNEPMTVEQKRSATAVQPQMSQRFQSKGLQT